MPDGSILMKPAAPPRTRLMLGGAVLPSLLRLAAPNVGEAAAVSASSPPTPSS